MTLSERITRVLESWFLLEPALFQVLCAHQLVENSDMACPVRCGRMRVEYNPQILEEMSDAGLDEALRTEAVRILLKHPYERRPDQCSDQAIAIGSNITVGDNYKYGSFNIETPKDYELESGKTYEWYSRKVQEMLPESGGGNSGSNEQGGDVQQKFRDLAELWQEDDMAVAMINGIIESIKSWGSLAGAFAEQLQADTRAKINWKNVFAGFRASILSSRKTLTRMRPSRRYGFDSMGSRRDFDTKLLVAVDVSGSITSKSLSYFYGVINNAFKYGFKSIDVIQFDCGVRVVQSLKKVMRDVTVVGRGGTSFQEPIDYAAENGYDGLLILTDGYAPPPSIPEGFKTKIVWVCEERSAYEAHHSWMEKLGRVCTIELR